MQRKRINQIIEMIKEKHAVTNAEIMDRFNISIETVRRDLSYLERTGVIERVYGGAVIKAFINSEPEYLKREKFNEHIKHAIAKKAVQLIESNATVFFDLGTTVMTVAKLLDEDKAITAFTNSMRTATVLAEKGFDTIVSGGRVRPGELSVSGAEAQSFMQKYNIDTAIIGAAGITSEGVTDFIADEAFLRRQVIENASKVIVVADYSKFAIRAMCNVCPVRSIDVLITDEKAPQKIIKDIKNQGVKVITV